MLRAAKANSSMGGNREVPPHLVASLRHASFSYDGQTVFEGDAFAVLLLNDSDEYFDNEEEYYQYVYDSRTNEADSYPQLRSGRNVDNRYNPHTQRGRTQHMPPDRATTPTNTQHVPVIPTKPPIQVPSPKTSKVEDICPPENDVQMVDPPAPTPVKRAPTTIPRPQNPINREDGWKKSLPKKQEPLDSKPVPKVDEKKSLPPGTHYKFTSQVQEQGPVWI